MRDEIDDLSVNLGVAPAMPFVFLPYALINALEFLCRGRSYRKSNGELQRPIKLIFGPESLRSRPDLLDISADVGLSHLHAELG